MYFAFFIPNTQYKGIYPFEEEHLQSFYKSMYDCFKNYGECYTLSSVNNINIYY